VTKASTSRISVYFYDTVHRRKGLSVGANDRTRGKKNKGWGGKKKDEKLFVYNRLCRSYSRVAEKGMGEKRRKDMIK